MSAQLPPETLPPEMRAFTPHRAPRWRRRLQIITRRTRLIPIIEMIAGVTFVIATLSSWAALSNPAGKSTLLPTGLTTTLLLGTLVPAMAILMLLGRRMALRRAAETIGGKGRLHVQLVLLFSMIAAVPTLLVVIFASWQFQVNAEFWFSDSSRGLLENANKLAHGYYEQTQRDVSQNAVAMAFDLDDALSKAPIASLGFQAYVKDEVLRRNLDRVAILQTDHLGRLQTLAFSPVSSKGPPPGITTADLRKLDAGTSIVINASADRIEALTPIDRGARLYLYAARSSDLLEIAQGRRAENIVRAYHMLTEKARLQQFRFNALLFGFSLTVVGFMVWLALRVADRQVQPLFDLVAAARQVGSGNYALRVAGGAGAGTDEIGLLTRAFNRMTAQIERQTQDLVGANQQLGERRAFIEAVLESVTAGVISLNAAGEVQLMNSSAQKLLLGHDAPPPVGLPLADIAPALASLVAEGRGDGIVQYGVERQGGGNDLLTLAVKLSRDRGGHVITFEDITRQLIDQRQAAWSDVARRIAHEIKNPLTPIQLATERLNRRYRKQITIDPELFEELTHTIIRQVGELRKMVDEFSSFARLPKPVFRPEDPVDLARQALFLQEVARSDIGFSFATEGAIAPIGCDRHQFGQAMTNVLKNATEAIDARMKTADEDYRGRINVAMYEVKSGTLVEIAVTDNGIGLPQDRERITEPYVTTRDKGTGLGLAIVKKIIEEHGGAMNFASAEGGGTRVTMRFARDPLGSENPQLAAE